MKLRIGIAGTRGIPNAYGGFEECAEFLSVQLAKRGHEALVYNSSLHPYKEENFMGVKIIHCRDWENRLGSAGQFIYDLNCIRDAQKRKLDVLLHLGYTSSSAWHRSWPKDAINIVNMDGLEWKRSKYNRLTKFFLKKAEGWAARHADELVADSPGIFDHLLDQYHRRSHFIAYGASIFTNPDPLILTPLALAPKTYSLLIARMEPENHIEMIINGFLANGDSSLLVVVGDVKTVYGRAIQKKYESGRVLFTGGIYDKAILNNLRYFSSHYFHGHSVGGTNPSLLEAMACSCNIIAHENIFNKAVLGDDANYFSNAADITKLLVTRQLEEDAVYKENNLRKIREKYSWEKITNDYEQLMINAVAQRKQAGLPRH
jgi:glycosyltransferase involved in cell wall biosynthesis